MRTRFDAGYREEIVLRDGTRVELRAVGPRDREILRAGFAKLSPESRYLRFFTAKKALTEKELRYLTELDGVRHFAIGAVTRDGDGEEGLGVARFIRDRDDSPVAEFAIAVADRMGGRGLGKVLLSRLIEAARTRGITQLSCDVLDSNTRMQGLLEELGGATVTNRDAGVLHLVFPLPEEHAHENVAYRLLRLAAEGLLPLRRWLDRRTEP